MQVASLRADAAHRDAAEQRKIDAAILAVEEREAEKRRVEEAAKESARRADEAVAVEAARAADAAKRLVEDRALLARLKPMREACLEGMSTHGGMVANCEKWLADAATSPKSDDAAARRTQDETAERNRSLLATSQSELSQCKSRLTVLELAIRQLSRRIGSHDESSEGAPMGPEEAKSVLLRLERQRETLVADLDEAPPETDVRASTEWRTVLDLAIAEAGRPAR
jgi:hypothetical protein